MHAKEGHVVEAWTTLEDDRPKHEVRGGYLVRRFRPLFSLFSNPLTISILPQLLRYEKTNFDLIVAHSHLMFTTIFASIKSWLSQRPLVLISHGYEVKRGFVFDMLLRVYLITIGRSIVRNSSFVVALTSREANRLQKLGVPRERCDVIPSGVDSNFFRPNGKPTTGRRIVWTGRFVREKNLECLIRTVALLKAKMPNVELILAGEGPERLTLMRLSKDLEVHTQVKFTGVLPPDGIVTLLHHASVFALPSTAEALPIAILEAMSCGVPLVVAKGLGLEEIVDGSALFADNRDPAEWAAKIEKLLEDNELRRRMGSRGRELAVGRYDWQKVADRLGEVFGSLAIGN